MNSLHENEINDFFHYASSRLDECGSIRLITSKPNPYTCSGTDYCNYKLRILLLHGNKSNFFGKTRDEIKKIIFKNSANGRTDLNHLNKIRRCWNLYIQNTNINFTFGFSENILRIKYV